MTPNEFGITPELVAFVKRQEGWVPHTYRCPAGYPTQGYGRRVPTMARPPITKEEGERWLREDLRSARDDVLRYSPRLAGESERRLAAVVDFVFNCGVGRYRASTLRRRVEARDWPAAATEMRRWVYAAGRKFGPLVTRRAITARWLEEA